MIKSSKSMAILAGIVMLPAALSGCGGAGMAAGSALGALSGAVQVVQVANSAAAIVDPIIAKACGIYSEGSTAANMALSSGLVPASVGAKVTSIQQYGNAACANPPSGDALSTAVWLGKLVGQITTLTGTKT